MPLSSSVFLTGPPRIGKSTLVSKVISYFRTNNPEISLRGFYTEQVTTTLSSSKYEKRIGFDIITLDGNLGDYYVNVEEFEKLVIPSILHQNDEFNDNDSNKNEIKKKTLIIIDEIGKMESFSKDFEDIVRNMIFNQKINNHNNHNNKICIFGTVALKFKGGLAEEIRNASSHKPFSSSIFTGAGGSGGGDYNIKVSEITLQNRDKMFQIIINELKKMLEI
ncbi:8330_t:CDS:2 [Diversispora eburnea]|uniref:8330_t:CDS:1 n=1 Tax=Diversispora eburnea TaxID=1213867 RepID=A0A9N9A2C8_9GLOM|nr:8330_t:CDS:2 [Diversispora eburnea]